MPIFSRVNQPPFAVAQTQTSKILFEGLTTKLTTDRLSPPKPLKRVIFSVLNRVRPISTRS